MGAIERGIARLAVRHLLLRPMQQLAALPFEIGLQILCRPVLAEHDFIARGDVEVDEREVDFVQPLFLAEQPAVDLYLRPVQRAMIAGHALEVALVGLDLLELVEVGVVAVGAAAHEDVAELPGQRDLGLVVRMPARGDDEMAGHALDRGWRRREALVEVADLGCEFAQAAHRDDVAERVFRVFRGGGARSDLDGGG